MRALLIGEVIRTSTGLANALREIDAAVTLVFMSDAGAGQRRLHDDPPWNLALIDDLLPGRPDAFQVLADLQASGLAIPTIVLARSERRADVLRALDLGAVGVVPFDAPGDTLVEALRLVLGGGIYVPPSIMRGDRTPPVAAVGFDPSWDGRLHDCPPTPAQERSPASLGLTPRQTDVLFLLLQGQTNKQIARELNLSVETVKEHVAAVLRTLHVNSRAKAVLAVNPLHSPLWDWRSRRAGLGLKR